MISLMQELIVVFLEIVSSIFVFLNRHTLLIHSSERSLVLVSWLSCQSLEKMCFGLLSLLNLPNHLKSSELTVQNPAITLLQDWIFQ
jgi:hypothetical protein